MRSGGGWLRETQENVDKEKERNQDRLVVRAISHRGRRVIRTCLRARDGGLEARFLAAQKGEGGGQAVH